MATAGFLAQTASLLIFGKLYDILEPKLVMLSCLCLFLSGSIISATSNSFNILIAGQAVAGLGRSGIVVGCVLMLAIIARSKAERALYIAIVSGGYGAMLKLAPIIAGLILRKPGKQQWRWIFWVAVPVQSLLIVLVLAFPKLRRRRATWAQLAKFDIIGGLLQAVGICTMIMPLLVGRVSGGTPYDSPKLIVLYVLTPIIHSAFLYWEYRKPEAERYIPIDSILRNRSIPALAVLTINSSLIIAAATFFLPPYLQVMRRSTPLTSALQQLPGVLLGSAASVVVGKFLGFGRPRVYQALCIVGSLFQIVGGLIWWFTTPDFSWAIFYIDSIIVSIGAGMLFAVGITLILDLVPDELFGQASAFMSAATATGAVVGVAVQGILIQRGLEFMLNPLGGESALDGFQSAAQKSPSNDGINAPKPGSDPLADDVAGIVKDAYHETQRQASLMFMAAGITSLIASLLLKRHAPSSQEKSVDVAKVEKMKGNGPDGSSGSSATSTLKETDHWTITNISSAYLPKPVNPPPELELTRPVRCNTIASESSRSSLPAAFVSIKTYSQLLRAQEPSSSPRPVDTEPPLVNHNCTSVERVKEVMGAPYHTFTTPKAHQDSTKHKKPVLTVEEQSLQEETELMLGLDSRMVDVQLAPPQRNFVTKEYSLERASTSSVYLEDSNQTTSLEQIDIKDKSPLGDVKK